MFTDTMEVSYDDYSIRNREYSSKMFKAFDLSYCFGWKVHSCDCRLWVYSFIVFMFNCKQMSVHFCVHVKIASMTCNVVTCIQ